MNPCEYMDGLDMDLAHAANHIERLERCFSEIVAAAIKVDALSIQTDAHKELRRVIRNVTANSNYTTPTVG